MKNLIRVIALATALSVSSGCGPFREFGPTYTAVTEAKVSVEAVVIARSTFNALEVSATGYLNLRRCTGSNGPVCRDPKVTKTIIAAVRSGRIARNNLTQFMRDHPGELGPAGLYDVLTASNRTLQDALATYRANS